MLKSNLDNIFSKIKKSPRFLLTFFILAFIILLSPNIVGIIIGGKIIEFSTLLLCILLSPLIILQPLKGIIILPALSYIVPAEFHYKGISMGFAISAVTMFSSLIYIISGKSKPRLSWIWILITLMLSIQFYFSASPHQLLKSFIQGIAPFVIFSFVIKKESEGRMVLKYWLASFAIFALVHFIRGGVLYPDESIIRSLSAIRNEELGGHNPNVLGWLCLLYAAICPCIALAEKNYKKRRRWWILFMAIVLLIIFSFSRAAMAGLLLTLILLVFLLGIISKNFSKIMIPTIISFLMLFIIWSSAVDAGIMDKGRTMNVSSMTPELNKRTQMVLAGWLMFFEYPWGYGPNNSISTHSGFTKAALDFGVLYFILFCIPFLYLIRVGYVILKNHNDISIRMLGSGILSASIVGIFQTIYGVTMFTAEYAQVFWLFVGYMELLNSEFKKSNQKHFLLQV